MGENRLDKMVIIINGAGGAGKDTICGIAARRYPVLNVSSIDPIKEIALLGGWNCTDKSLAGRKLLADLKRAFVEYNDLPAKYVTDKFHAFLQDENLFLFVHIREAEEIDKFKKTVCAERTACRTLLVRTERTERTFGNPADDDVSNYPYDFIYDNEKSPEEMPEDFIEFFEKHILKHG